ncbi:MAG TPA: NAD-dependent epimerase/dehydratase family protein [Pirellulaceae bacterium]|nr:NAD-dependent epimerase/dehydratase family protein [Pirellulaceae bacterium]
MKTALVTGANGFLGRALCRLLLERGYRVQGTVRTHDEFLARQGVALFVGDLRGDDIWRTAVPGCNVVFHLAAVSGIWGTWKHFHSSNTIATRLAVQACIAHRVPKLVYTSSPSVTFTGEHQINVDESAPYPQRWLCHYAHSKALAEQHVLESNDPAVLMTCALRPHLVWGPGDRHLVPRLLERAARRQLLRVGDGTNQIDTIYVDNAAEAHILAAEALTPGSPVCGQSYFLSQGDPVNCWGWINEILQWAGMPRVKKSISFAWAWRLGQALEIYHEMFNIQREPRMTRFLAAQLAKSHYFDISRARRDFGFTPRVTMEEGMKRLEGHLKTSS